MKGKLCTTIHQFLDQLKPSIPDYEKINLKINLKEKLKETQKEKLQTIIIE